MAKTEIVQSRIEPLVKKQAAAIFKTLGLSTSEAIALFLKQVTLQDGIPFSLHIPNKRTARALQQATARRGLKRYDSLDALKAKLED